MRSAHRGNLLINALFKARRPSYIGKVDRGEWCGCFTFNEVLELVKHGAIETSLPSYTTIPWIEKQVAAGRNDTTWFYFYPNGIKMLTEEEKKGMK